jgi:hypothetical protein
MLAAHLICHGSQLVVTRAQDDERWKLQNCRSERSELIVSQIKDLDLCNVSEGGLEVRNIGQIAAAHVDEAMAMAAGNGVFCAVVT